MILHATYKPLRLALELSTREPYGQTAYAAVFTLLSKQVGTDEEGFDGVIHGATLRKSAIFAKREVFDGIIRQLCKRIQRILVPLWYHEHLRGIQSSSVYCLSYYFP
jgi:hypothetical protein